MGLLVTIVYALGSIGLKSKKEGEKDDPELATGDKVGAHIFVITVGLYMTTLWIFEKLLEFESSAVIIVLVFIFLNFGVAFLVVWLSTLPNLRFSHKPALRQEDTDNKNLGQMFKSSKYICILFIFLFIEGCAF